MKRTARKSANVDSGTRARESTADLLLRCETENIAPPYVVDPGTYREQQWSILRQSLPIPTRPVPLNSNGDDLFIVSDLHIASGRDDAGVFPGTENFFADESFGRFLEYALTVKKSPGAVLVINGDMFDFLRVTGFPGKVARPGLTRRIRRALKRLPAEPRQAPLMRAQVQGAFEEWSAELARVGIVRSPGELESSISARERRLGLGTEDFKAVCKLNLIRKGHPEFFRALSSWVARGHRLIILKGNHDLEWFWPAVRNYFRLLIADGIAASGKGIDHYRALKERVLPAITFIDDAALVDDVFYLEHGHRYDRFAMVLDSPVLASDPRELAIPFGSFFNRYLVNRIELFYPFIDNVTPATNILPMMMKENFPLALKILFRHVPLLVRVLFTRIRYVWFMIHAVVWIILALLAPVVAGLIFDPGLFSEITGALGSPGPSGIAGFFVTLAKNTGLLIFSYLLARAVAWYQLEEPTSLESYAAARRAGEPFTLMTMGHTHVPGEDRLDGGCRFYNSGTWIPVVETSTAAIREDRTYTFLHVTHDSSGGPSVAGGKLLQRWNDDAMRGESHVVIGRK